MKAFLYFQMYQSRVSTDTCYMLTNKEINAQIYSKVGVIAHIKKIKQRKHELSGYAGWMSRGNLPKHVLVPEIRVRWPYVWGSPGFHRLFQHPSRYRKLKHKSQINGNLSTCAQPRWTLLSKWFSTHSPAESRPGNDHCCCPEHRWGQGFPGSGKGGGGSCNV